MEYTYVQIYSNLKTFDLVQTYNDILFALKEYIFCVLFPRIPWLPNTIYIRFVGLVYNIIINNYTSQGEMITDRGATVVCRNH